MKAILLFRFSPLRLRARPTALRPEEVIDPDELRARLHKPNPQIPVHAELKRRTQAKVSLAEKASFGQT